MVYVVSKVLFGFIKVPSRSMSSKTAAQMWCDYENSVSPFFIRYEYSKQPLIQQKRTKKVDKNQTTLFDKEQAV